MQNKADNYIEYFTNILSKYITDASLVKLKQSYKFLDITKHSKSTIIDEHKLRDSFCILIYGIIRHYTIDSITTEEQTLHFTFPNNILSQYITSTNTKEYIKCISDCTILYISNSVLKEIGEEINLKIYSQNLKIKDLESEIRLLRMTPEKRFEKLHTEYQNIFLTIPLKYIASFLGITPQALCRIRKRLLF